MWYFIYLVWLFSALNTLSEYDDIVDEVPMTLSNRQRCVSNRFIIDAFIHLLIHSLRLNVFFSSLSVFFNLTHFWCLIPNRLQISSIYIFTGQLDFIAMLWINFDTKECPTNSFASHHIQFKWIHTFCHNWINGRYYIPRLKKYYLHSNELLEMKINVGK